MEQLSMSSDWESLLATPEDRDRLLSMVTEMVTDRYGECEINREGGAIGVPSKGCVISLGPLANEVAGLNPKQWRMAVYSKVSHLDDIDTDLLLQQLGDYHQISDRLRVRIKDYAQHHPDTRNMEMELNPYTKPLPLGLVATLSVALPNAAAEISQNFVDQWDVDPDWAFNEALSNTLKQGTWELYEVVDGENQPAGFYVFEGTDTASNGLHSTALLLDPNLSITVASEMGAVMSIPKSDTIGVCPIDPVDTFSERINAFTSHSLAGFHEGPNPVSPKMLWWREGHQLEGFAHHVDGVMVAKLPSELLNHIKSDPATGPTRTHEPPSLD